MINLDALRTERQTLEDLRDELRRAMLLARSSGDRSREAEQARQIREIGERLAAIADELLGPCIVV